VNGSLCKNDEERFQNLCPETDCWIVEVLTNWLLSGVTLGLSRSASATSKTSGLDYCMCWAESSVLYTFTFSPVFNDTIFRTGLEWCGLCPMRLEKKLSPEKEGTELICSSYLNWWRDCLPLRGHIFFKKAEDTSTRGHTWKLAKKHCRCDSRLYFFSQRVINRWNKLSQEDVDDDAQSINCFKNRLEKRRTRQVDFFKDL